MEKQILLLYLHMQYFQFGHNLSFNDSANLTSLED